MEAVLRAERHPSEEVVFLGVGFETTAPTIACAMLEARRRNLANFSLLCAHKTVPPAMIALLSSGEVAVDGFLCPGHVSVVIGSDAYRPIVEQFHVPSVIGGFEPVDILDALRRILLQLNDGRAEVETQYTRAVRPEGSPKALSAMYAVFEPSDSVWRGIGLIPGSGMKLRPSFANMDALVRFGIEIPEGREHPACRCGDVLRGTLRPAECGAFGRACTPESPLGPCMVSSEGSCAAEFRYGAEAR
jgi:hydrogenase expression/formation protein HypD